MVHPEQEVSKKLLRQHYTNRTHNSMGVYQNQNREVHLSSGQGVTSFFRPLGSPTPFPKVP
jgi:hypothetical protein